MTSTGVAVIVPAYRSEDYLAAALDSALAQTLPPDEIVVVDDGSPDNTCQIVEPYLDRVLYVAQTENRGPGAARNLGLRVTRSPLVAFLDADDLWETHKLEVQVDWLDRHPDHALVCSDAIVFGDGLEPVRKYRSRHPDRLPDLGFAGLIVENSITTLTVLARRAAIEAVGPFDEDPRLIAVEDYELWLRLAARYRLGYVDEALGRYRKHPQNLSGARRFLDGVGRILDLVANRNPGSTELRPLLRRRRCQLQLDLAWEFLQLGQVRSAVRPILEALAISPRDPLAWRFLARGLLGWRIG